MISYQNNPEGKLEQRFDKDKDNGQTNGNYNTTSTSPSITTHLPTTSRPQTPLVPRFERIERGWRAGKSDTDCDVNPVSLSGVAQGSPETK